MPVVLRPRGASRFSSTPVKDNRLGRCIFTFVPAGTKQRLWLRPSVVQAYNHGFDARTINRIPRVRGGAPRPTGGGTE